jgi:putative ABC transport system permease protein
MDFEGEREQQQREALQARTQNLSYRTKLSPAETIIKGSFPESKFSGSGLPALSVEEGFSKRVGVKIGDKMRFDVLGVPLIGEVTSIRKVRWTSFEPNFMILVQPGPLEDAPKIWVTSASGIAPENIDRVQTDLIKQHPNISVVDVKSAVHRLMGFVDQVSIAVSMIALLALAGGAGVLYAIAYAQAMERLKSVAILKTLGASPNDALRSILIEYGLIAAAAVIFGITLGGVVTWAAGAFILKTSWQPSDLQNSMAGFLIIPICLGLTWIATRGVKKSSIVSLLQ